MSERNFFAELRRRNVYKVAVAYAVVGWLLIQVATQVFPFLEIPNWVIRLVIALITLGFPIALIVAWAFESTPEGIKRTEVADATHQHSKSRAWIYVVVIGAAISLGLFFLGRYSARSASGNAPSPMAEKSIAVLPFQNLSEEKANAFFAEGIQDEILTRLAKIGALKVISRTSTAHYASSPQNLRQIARELGVANILEGSVQKARDAVHVNVQLIRAATDEHLWAESYDRKLDDIFAVEREVAQNIAAALNTKLTGAEERAIAQKPTANPAAYEAYLQGNTQLWQANEKGILGAIASYQEAIRLDPQFALAWAGLTRAASIKFHFSETTPAVGALGEQALREAERIDPQLPDTQLARAYFAYYVKDDLKGAYDILEQVRMIWPGNYEIQFLLGLLSSRLGEWQRSLDYLAKAAELSPREPYLRENVVQMQYAARDLTSALRSADDALQIWPGNTRLLACKAQVLQALGDLDQAQAVVNAMKVGDKDYYALDALWMQAKLRRDPSLALPFFESLSSRETSSIDWLSDAVYLGRLQELAGDRLKAGETFAAVRSRGEEVLRQQPNNTGVMTRVAIALGALGERDAALSLIDKVRALRSADKRVEPMYRELRARILTRYGDNDGAIALLTDLLHTNYESYSGPPITVALLRLDPDFDPLRKDPRFADLIAKQAAAP